MLDSGNALHGADGLVLETSGRAVAMAMSAMGYDAMALGRHDLALGTSTLHARMEESSLHMLSANTVLADSNELFTQPYLLIKRAGYTIGILGLSEPLGTVDVASEGDTALVILDPFEFSLPHIQSVIAEADVVIVLSNMGRAMDEMLASSLSGIDIIIGGRDRLIMPPTRYDTTGPIMVQVGSRGQLIGLLEVEISAAGDLVGFEGKPYLLTAKYADDPVVVELLATLAP